MGMFWTDREMKEKGKEKSVKRVWLRGWMRKKEEKKKRKQSHVCGEKKKGENRNYIIIFSQYFYNKF